MVYNFDIPNIRSPLKCLPGIFDQEKLNELNKVFLEVLYFGVSKLIARRWIHTMEQLKLGMWLKVVNADVLLYDV